MCSDGSGDALADLESVLDRLADVNLKGLFGPQRRTWRPDGTEILILEPVRAPWPAADADDRWSR